MKREKRKQTKQSAVSRTAATGIPRRRRPSRRMRRRSSITRSNSPVRCATIASPEALHKLRVSLRRLRSLWWAFEPLLEKGETTRERALYKYLATAAGKTRDWDILIELIAHERQRCAGELDAHDSRTRAARALATSRETLSNADVKHLLHEALSSHRQRTEYLARARVAAQIRRTSAWPLRSVR